MLAKTSYSRGSDTLRMAGAQRIQQRPVAFVEKQNAVDFVDLQRSVARPVQKARTMGDTGTESLRAARRSTSATALTPERPAKHIFDGTEHAYAAGSGRGKHIGQDDRYRGREPE